MKSEMQVCHVVVLRGHLYVRANQRWAEPREYTVMAYQPWSAPASVGRCDLALASFARDAGLYPGAILAGEAEIRQRMESACQRIWDAASDEIDAHAAMQVLR